MPRRESPFTTHDRNPPPSNDPAGREWKKCRRRPDQFGAWRTLSGAISNFFPHAKLTSGAIAISTGGPASPAVSAVAIRQPAAGLAISTLPVSPTPLTGNPVTIAPAMDASHQVSANISTAGGTLNLTDAAGNQFSLTIPANAVLSPVMITMTPVTAISGLPQGTFAAGVELGPDGLELFAPATLTVNLAAPVNSPVPLGWHGTGSGIYLNPLQPGSKTLTMQLMHFSGAGSSNRVVSARYFSTS